MSEYIPLEIQEEILKRLPVKPLIQFRSVSKPWKCLIDSPEFTAANGARETHPNRLILRYNDNIDFKVRYITFVDNDDDDTFIMQDFAHTVPKLIKNMEPNLNVVGSSHGLLCLVNYKKKERVVIWNPSISKCIGIEVLCGSPDEHVIGFGVCRVTLDPTIVNMEFFGVWKVGVFSLSTGIWSILSTNLPRASSRNLGNWSQVVIGRFIYWLAFDCDFEDGQTQSPFLIMSFDLTAKEFKEINLTGSLTDQLYSIKTISKLRESLVVLAKHSKFENSQIVCCLWMMEEQGISKSFTKLYTIKVPDAMVETLLGFRKTGDLILETRQPYEHNTELEVYEPSSKAIDNLGIDGEDYYFMCYMETLLLHDLSDGFIYSISS